MNHLLPLPLLAVLLGFSTGAARAGFTYETPTELSSQADFNNDGHPDLAVFDRETGVLRILTSLSGVSFSASANFWTGLDEVDSLSAGSLTGGRGAVALASSLDNRAQTVVPQTSTQNEIAFGNRSHPGALILSGLLPGQITVFPTPAGNLFLSTDLNDAPVPRQLTRLTLAASGAGTLFDTGNNTTGQTGVLRRGNAVPWSGRQALGFVVESAGGSAFSFHHGTPDPRAASSQLDSLPAGAHWLHADFASQTGRTAFLFYQKSGTTFEPREAQAVTGASPVSFSGFPPRDLGAPIHLLMTVVLEDAKDRLLALLDGGARAVLYDYTNGSAPVVRQSWNAPAGEAFTMAAPLANGSFLLLSGKGGRSMNWQRYDTVGNSYRNTISGPFGCKSLQSRHATLFYFSHEPFVNPNAVLRRLFRERDWTDIGSGLLTPVTRYTDGGPRAGLSEPSGWLPPPGNFDGSVLVTNQFTRTATAGQAPISITTLSNGTGNVDAKVHFDPPAGTYPPLLATFTPQGPDDPIQPYAVTFPVRLSTQISAGILYRLSPDQPWQTYTQPIALSGTATVQAKVSGLNKVQSAAYRFELTPDSAAPLTLPPAADANGNGLPDDWEAAFAQSNPAADTDGDGFTALQEYQNGTDPRDNFSVTPPSVVVPSPDYPFALAMETVPGSGGTKNLRLSWSVNLHAAMLQGSDNLTTWQPVSQDIVIEGNRIAHYSALPGPGSSAPARRFYRLLRAEICP